MALDTFFSNRRMAQGSQGLTKDKMEDMTSKLGLVWEELPSIARSKIHLLYFMAYNCE
jgi:hypothetical protein